VRNILLIISIFIFAFFSCTKEFVNEKSLNFFNDNFKNKTIVVAGSTLDDGAVVWINENKIKLIGNALEATGLFHQSNKIYVTGWTYGGTGSVWVMDMDGSNQIQTELEGKFSEGQRITIHNGDIYVGGYFQNGSCFWKNGSKINLTINADSMSWGIGVDENSNLFNVGYYMKSHSLIPSYWKNGKRKNLSKPTHGDGEAKYIEIVNNKKFIGGTTSAPHNFLGYITKPTYWVEGQRKTGNIGSIDEGWQNSEVFDMLVDDKENVYLAGFSQDMDAEYPTYWKNGQKHLISNGEVSGVIRGIETVDGELVSTGTLSYFPGTPCLWVGDKTYVYDQNAVGEVWDMLVIN
jgi:hypothetical protein